MIQMLKIKDNVDLGRLENFGFDFDKYDYYYDFKPYKENDGSYLLVRKDTKELYIDYVELEHINKAVSILYDLIKADLVEKVE